MSDGRAWGTVIGGVVGFFTAGVGFAAGAAIGGAVGGLLEPKQRTETNRIDDIKVSISKYGDGIPETHGNNIPSATCVWSTYIIELPEEPTGGKGGGVENTNYRQYIQSMWCVGRTPPPGTTVSIRKVWIDGKLNYDASSGLSVAQALATRENPWASIALLPGFDGQLPVPMIETYEGVGNVPAFLGRMCIFIFGLECPGGRVPQLQFELAMNVAHVTDVSAFCSVVTDSPLGYHAYFTPTGIWHLREFETSPGHKNLDIYYGGAGYSEFVRSQPLSFSKAGAIHDWPCLPCHGSSTPLALRSQTDSAGTTSKIELIELETGVSRGLLTYSKTATEYPLVSDIFASCCCDESATIFAMLGGGEAWQPREAVLLTDGHYSRCAPITGTTAGPIAMQGGVLYILTVTAGTLTLERRSAVDGSVLSAFPGPTPDVVWDVRICALYASERGIYAQVPGENRGNQCFYKVDATSGAWTLLTEIETPGSYPSASANFYSTDDLHLIGPSESTDEYSLISKSINPTMASVADFIESQNLRAGLTADQIDLSTIEGEFWGLTLKSPASARANITPLLTYGAIGVVEEDGLLRYFHRADKTSVATIAYDELGFAEDGSKPGDPFPFVRANAQELPRSITLSYNDPGFDYQVSTVKAMRYAVDSVLDLNETLDIAMSGDVAASIVRRMLYERWLSQMVRSCAVSRKFALLSAGDVATVEYPRGTFRDYMISKLSDTGARMEIECFAMDADLAIQTVPGPAGYRAQQIEPLLAPQRLELLDGPIVRDQDDNAGVYAAMEPFGGGLPGAELFVGPDDESLQSRGIVTNAAVIGLAENALGDWSSPLMDERNSLIVNIGADLLNSTTRALIDTTTVNAFALGANGRVEYGQFLRAADLGGGRFHLSGLVRGCRGTERNRGTHLVGDRFILLTLAGMLRPSMDVGSIGTAYSYRAVSAGRSLNSASSQRYANTAEGLKPFSPWDARWTKSTGNDITLTWKRRSRLSSNALRGVIPLGEVTEAYAVELYTSSALTTLAGTFTSTTSSITITSAQQAAIGLTPGATPFRRIYQISDSVGRGAPLEAIS